MNENDMRALYERLLAERSARGVREEVPIEDLVAVVERRGSEEERARVLNRALKTAEGRRELDLVRAAVVAARQPAPLSFLMPMAIAAGLLIMFAGGIMLWRFRPTSDVMRGASGAIELASPVEPVSDTLPVLFVWRRVPAALSYEIELVNDAGDLVFQRALTDTTVALPRDVALKPGATYLWRVIARTSAGSSSSESRRLEVRAR